MVYRYFSISRPVAVGNFPAKGLLRVHNFGGRMFCKELGRKAWGYIEYDRPLQQFDLNEYYLVER